jgi:hypothetical protein
MGMPPALHVLQITHVPVACLCSVLCSTQEHVLLGLALLSYMSISPAGCDVAYRQEEVDRAQRYDPEHLQMPWLQAMDSVGA